ncbi:hypothetical protein [Arthrobacter sp. UYCu723]
MPILARITRGNFRLIDRLFTQLERVREINELSITTPDVIEAAAQRSSSESAKPPNRAAKNRHSELTVTCRCTFEFP